MDRPDPLVADLRRRWAAGDRVTVERLLAARPGLAADPDRLLDLIYAEVLLREEAGERPRAEEYVARFPPLAAAIRTQFEVHEAIEPAEELPELPGYDVLREIGRGGAGAVYEATERETGRAVAVKLIRPDLFASAAARKRFGVEARVGLLVAHPNIVPVHAVGDSPAGPYLAMELMAGSLEDAIREGPLTPVRAVEALLPVAEAAHAAHEQGVVHRDIKPANVLFGRAGGVKLSDFGLAKLVIRWLAAGLSSTQHGAVLGTPAYMPPEQAAGTAEPGPAQDVYSLGGVLFAALTGRPPFNEGSVLATLLRARAGRPPSPQAVRPDVPAELDRICLRCLSADPADRYSTAAALVDELRGWVRDQFPDRPEGVRFRLVSLGGGGPVTGRATAAGVVLGRSSACDVVMQEDGISRRHCRLVARDGVFVEDLDSRHGTRVNGEPVAGPTRLAAGDVLKIARWAFRVELPG